MNWADLQRAVEGRRGRIDVSRVSKRHPDERNWRVKFTWLDVRGGYELWLEGEGATLDAAAEDALVAIQEFDKAQGKAD